MQGRGDRTRVLAPRLWGRQNPHRSLSRVALFAADQRFQPADRIKPGSRGAMLRGKAAHLRMQAAALGMAAQRLGAQAFGSVFE